MKTQKQILCLVAVLCFYLASSAQVIFQKEFSLLNESTGTFSLKTADGGFLLAGTTGASNTYGQGRITLTKTDANGNTVWDKNYGGNVAEYVSAVLENPDGSFTLVGTTFSGNSQPYGDALMMKVSSTGTILWTKVYFGSQAEYANNIIRLANGDYIFCGITRTYTGTGDDTYVVRTDSLGNPLWGSIISEAGNNDAMSMVLADDGNLMVFGSANVGLYLMFLSKLDIATGNTIWAKKYSNSIGSSFGRSIHKTADGGYFLAGWCDGSNNSFQNFYLVKTDSAGNPIWSHVYGGTGEELAYSACATNDGGFAICGYTKSYGAGGQDMYLMRVNALGSLQWSGTYGTPGNEIAIHVTEANDGGFLLTGSTSTGFFSGYSEMLVIKTDALGYVPCDYIPATSVKYGDTAILVAPNSVFLSAVGAFSYVFTTQSGMIDSTLCTAVSVFETVDQSFSFSLFPNPTENATTLSFEQTTPKEIRVLNLFGQEILHLQNCTEQRLELNTENWSSGVYLVEVKSGEKIGVHKLIVR
ncbi:MAG: T9SS type A sorting domain-containing protein [Bacteroidia bacterium]